MQLVLSNNRVIAHGENFLAMGGVVINTKTGAKYDNATVAECEGCPSDINEVGYEYKGGVFVPCAPYGKGNNNGYFMEVCESCATPRNSGIPIKGGIRLENLSPEVTAIALGSLEISLLWENTYPYEFAAQTITLASDNYTFLLVEARGYYLSYDEETGSNIVSFIPLSGGFISGVCGTSSYDGSEQTAQPDFNVYRYVKPNGDKVKFGNGYRGYADFNEGNSPELGDNPRYCIPIKIYGVKL